MLHCTRQIENAIEQTPQDDFDHLERTRRRGGVAQVHRAPHKGFSGYQSLLKAYVSDVLRRDGAVHVFGSTARLSPALRKRGVSAKLVKQAVEEAAA